MRVAVVAIIALLLALPAASAAVELEVEPEQQEKSLNSHMRFWYTLTNNGPADTFTLETAEEHREWRFPTYLAKHLEAGEEFSAPLDYYISGYWTGSFPVTLRAQSLSDPSVAAEDAFTLVVTGKLIPGVSDVSLEYANGRLAILYELSTERKRPVAVTFTVRGPDGRFLKEVSATRENEGVQKYAEAVELGELGPGAYSVVASAEGRRTEDRFIVAAEQKLAVITETIPTPLFDQVTVTVENMGNAPASYELAEAVAPGDAVTGLAFAGAACDGQKCVRTVTVEPGETETMRYNVAHGVPFQAAAGLLVLAAAGGAGYMHANRPRIKKRVVRHNAERHSVILEVKNPRRHTENVVVRDIVSPLAHVLQEFEAVKPVVNRTDSGTELVWKLGGMKPRETRMLSYKVKPLVADPVRLGRARMHYQDQKGRRGVHHSSEATVAA